MAKKTKDETMEFFYADENESSNNKNQGNRNVPNKPVSKKNRINLDDEIIIGLTPKQEPKKDKPKKQVSNTKNNSKTKKKTKKTINKKAKVKKKKTIKSEIIKWTTIVLIIIAAVIIFLLSPVFNIRQVKVVNTSTKEDGTSKVSEEEIISLAQISNNQNIFRLSAKQIINNIKDGNTYIEDVSITRDLPNAVTITVSERVPRYVIKIANGNVYIDSKGNILEISTEDINKIVITGYETSIENMVDYKNTKKLNDNDLSKINLINQVYQAAENNYILNYITSIDISDSSNIKVYLDGEGKVAYLGDCTNANLRILYLKTMIEKESGKEGEAYINGDTKTLKPRPYFREKV